MGKHLIRGLYWPLPWRLSSCCEVRLESPEVCRLEACTTRVNSRRFRLWCGRLACTKNVGTRGSGRLVAPSTELLTQALEGVSQTDLTDAGAGNTADLTETGIQHVGNDPGNDVAVEDVEQLARDGDFVSFPYFQDLSNPQDPQTHSRDRGCRK